MAAAYPIDFAAAPLTGTTEDRLRALGVPVVTADDVRAAEAAWPQTEPDRSVWRILSNARAAGDELSDEQLRTALPACSIEEIAAARARVEGRIASEPMEITSTTTIHDLLAEPSITLDEAFACGLLDDRSDSESAERTSCDPDAEPACASST